MYARELPGAEGEDLPRDPDAGEDSLVKTPAAGITPRVALRVFPEALLAFFSSL